MSNLILTKTSFGGVRSIKRKYKYILNENKKIIGGFTKKNICDLNGKKVATRYQITSIKTNDGKINKVLLYKSELGKIKVINNQVFLNDEIIGNVEKREKNTINIILASMATIMLLLTLVFVSAIKLPYDEIPNIAVQDNKGDWGGEGSIGVLDSTIQPGSVGKYDFILTNEHNINLLYSFKIVEMYNGEIIEECPLEFRIKMNNIVLGTGEWLSAEDVKFSNLYILPESSQMFTLEWRWPFEGENNELDTLLGESNGKLQLIFKLTAESLGE